MTSANCVEPHDVAEGKQEDTIHLFCISLLACLFVFVTCPEYSGVFWTSSNIMPNLRVVILVIPHKNST